MKYCLFKGSDLDVRAWTPSYCLEIAFYKTITHNTATWSASSVRRDHGGCSIFVLYCSFHRSVISALQPDGDVTQLWWDYLEGSLVWDWCLMVVKTNERLAGMSEKRERGEDCVVRCRIFFFKTWQDVTPLVPWRGERMQKWETVRVLCPPPLPPFPCVRKGRPWLIWWKKDFWSDVDTRFGLPVVVETMWMCSSAMNTPGVEAHQI